MSDPLRVEMMMRLCERPYTGQLLSEKFGIPRAKIHYHLKELEKNGFIEIVYTEEKMASFKNFINLSLEALPLLPNYYLI